MFYTDLEKPVEIASAFEKAHLLTVNMSHVPTETDISTSVNFINTNTPLQSEIKFTNPNEVKYYVRKYYVLTTG